VASASVVAAALAAPRPTAAGGCPRAGVGAGDDAVPPPSARQAHPSGAARPPLPAPSSPPLPPPPLAPAPPLPPPPSRHSSSRGVNLPVVAHSSPMRPGHGAATPGGRAGGGGGGGSSGVRVWGAGGRRQGMARPAAPLATPRGHPRSAAVCGGGVEGRAAHPPPPSGRRLRGTLGTLAAGTGSRGQTGAPATRCGASSRGRLARVPRGRGAGARRGRKSRAPPVRLAGPPAALPPSGAG
jgi:hypothetical protein